MIRRLRICAISLSSLPRECFLCPHPEARPQIDVIPRIVHESLNCGNKLKDKNKPKSSKAESLQTPKAPHVLLSHFALRSHCFDDFPWQGLCYREFSLGPGPPLVERTIHLPRKAIGEYPKNYTTNYTTEATFFLNA